MGELLSLIVGVFAGGILGVTVMCLFQIHNVNKYELEIRKLRKELEDLRNERIC